MLENIDWAMLIGQALGIVAVILGFLAYQMRSPRALLVVHMVTCGVFCAHYLLIGAISGFALNAVGLVRDIVYTNRDKKCFASPIWPFLFAGIMLVTGLLSWQDWRSVLVICALIINTLALSLKSAQQIRYSLLLTCPMVLVYDLLLQSYGGVVFEGMSMVSSLIGILRFRRTGKETA